MKGYFVYMFLDENEEILYIGSSIHLVTRIESQHFSSQNGNLSEECILETHKILYHQGVSSDDMKIKERYLINTLVPKYNDKMNNNNRFSFVIENIDWKLFSTNMEELIEKRINKTGVSGNLINHRLEIKKTDCCWIPYAVYFKKLEKNIFFKIKNKELVENRSDTRLENVIKRFIVINNELYVNDSIKLSWHYAHYRQLSKEHNLKKGDFLSVLETKDLLIKESLDEELLEGKAFPLIGISFVKYEIAKKLKFYSDADIIFCDKKLSKFFIDNN